MRGVGLLANFSYSMTVLRKSNIFPNIKSEIANAPIIFFGVDRAMNRRMNITARIAKDARSWSEPLRVDKKLSNADSWREVHEEDQAALRPGLQDISISRT